MLRSLRLQVLWAPALAILVAALLTGVEVYARRHLVEGFLAASQMRRDIDRALLRISSRHNRTVRRAREAMIEPRPTEQLAILAPTSEHYLREMQRYVGEGVTVVHNLAATLRPSAPPELGPLESELADLEVRAQEVAQALDGLLAAVSSGDPEVLLLAELEFDRADKAMEAALSVATRSGQRAIDTAARAASDTEQTPLGAWAALFLLLVSSLFLAQRPLARMRRLAQGLDAEPGSREELLIAGRSSSYAAEVAALEARLVERTREAERATQSSRRAEQELALLRLYNENLVNSLRSAIVVTNGAGEVTGCNRTARTLLAFDAAVGAPIAAQPLYGCVAGRSSDARAELVRALAERAALRFDGVPYPTARGEILLDLTVAPYLDESGAARGLLWVADDVTDAVRVKKQLLAAERLAAVGSLSAQVAHEVRNPLSAIGLNAELLEEEIAGALHESRRQEASVLLKAIASEVERLTQITEGYLRLARLPHPEARDADLNQVVSDLVTMLAEELKGHKVTVALDLATPAPLAWGDPGQLRQALLNIVRNSREAMPGGGTLKVTTRSRGDTSIIEISDTGSGIAAEAVGRVFEPFFTTKKEGTGLGLSLTHQIVSQHGGSVEVASTSSRGTTLRLTLPRFAPVAGTEPQPA